MTGRPRSPPSMVESDEPLIVIRHVPKIDFMRWHRVGFAFPVLLTVADGRAYSDGRAELRHRFPRRHADRGARHDRAGRSRRDALEARFAGLGEVSLQQFGRPSDVLIRMSEQPGGDAAQMEAVRRREQALGPNVEYRRVEVVGPTVGSELIRAGVLATVLALVAIMVYVWFRFEWQFGVGAMVSIFHDVITTVGLFALLAARIQPDDAGGDPDDRRLFDQRHGRDL